MIKNIYKFGIEQTMQNYANCMQFIKKHPNMCDISVTFSTREPGAKFIHGILQSQWSY